MKKKVSFSSNLFEGPMFCMSVGEQLPRTDISQ